MASKQYISIIRLFHHCDIPTDGELNIPRIKKQLQAEFSIALEGFIEIEGFTYNRHEVIEEIERADFPGRLKFHKMIWESPQILQLLENSSIDLSTINEEFKSFWNNNEFDIFFSPYFAGPFNYISRTLLAELRLRDVGELLAYEGFLQPDDREEAFRPIRIFLDENMRTIRNVNWENYKMMRPKIAHWIDTDWYLFFNHLPAEFYEIKHDFTSAFINIGVAIQKSHRKDCKKLSEQLISLNDTPENLRQIIVSNHAVYTRSSGGSSNWGGFGWVGFIFFILIKTLAQGGCNDSTDNYKYNPTEIKYVLPDSIMKKLQHPGSEPTLDSIPYIAPPKIPTIKY